MINSSLANPTPLCDKLENPKLIDGEATFSISAVLIFGKSLMLYSSFKNGTFPSYTRPSSPSAQDTVTSCLSDNNSVVLPQPTMAGTPISRATIAAWQVRPPLLVMMAEA